MIEHRTLGVLTGEVGSGKSTLIRRLFASLDPMSDLPIYLCYASLKPREFYGGLLEAVGVEPVYTVSKARKLWKEVVRSRSAPGEQTIVAVIDEAHEMSEALKPLSELMCTQCLGIQKIFGFARHFSRTHLLLKR